MYKIRLKKDWNSSQVKQHHFSLSQNNDAVSFAIRDKCNKKFIFVLQWSLCCGELDVAVSLVTFYKIKLNVFLVLQIFGNVESKKKYIVDTFDGQCIPPKWLIQNDRNSFEPNAVRQTGLLDEQNRPRAVKVHELCPEF